MDESKQLAAYRTLELANLLGVSRRTLQRWRLEGGGPKYSRIGRDCLYLMSDIEAWLKQRQYKSRSEELSHINRHGTFPQATRGPHDV